MSQPNAASGRTRRFRRSPADCFGASRPLRRIPAIVSLLNPQPAHSLVGGNRSFMLRVFGRLPVTDSATRSRAGVRKASGEETAGGVCAGGGVGLWGFSADVGPDPAVWNRGDG